MKKLLVFGILTILIFIVYGFTLPFGLASDDHALSSKLWSYDVLISEPYIIGRNLIYFFMSQIVGNNFSLFRLSNILFHSANSYLVYLLLTILSTGGIALVVSVLFAIHPVMTESVTWISGGVYAEYTFFFLLSLLLYITAKLDNKKRFFSLIFFIVALATSEKAIILPFILTLYESQYGNLKKTWQRIIPFGVVALFYSFFLTFRFVTRLSLLPTPYAPTIGVHNPLIQIPYALGKYLQLYLFPHNLSFYHPFPQTTFLTNILLGIFLLFFTSAFVYAYKNNKQIFFWLAFFVITLSPTLLPVGVAWVVAERYSYLGSIGLLTVGVMIGSILLQRINQKKLEIWIALLLTLFLGLVTISRNRDWQSEFTLMRATAKTQPNLPNVHLALGVYYGQAQNYAQALQEFQKAIELKPDLASAYLNIGITYQNIGQPQKASEYFQKATALDPLLPIPK